MKQDYPSKPKRAQSICSKFTSVFFFRGLFFLLYLLTSAPTGFAQLSLSPPSSPLIYTTTDTSNLASTASTLFSSQQAQHIQAFSAPSDSTNLRKKPAKITVFGYYRLFLYGRETTAVAPPYDRAYGVGDGYREPMLSLNVLSRPNGKSSFGTELFFYTPYSGLGPEENVFSLNLGLNFYGSFRTEIGNFNIRAGGIHWYNLSPFTIGVYQVLDRFSIFDRTPWEGVDGISKYDNYYNTGSPNPGDLRWNNQAFQGIIINGAKLPLGFATDFFWGKTSPNGGLINAGSDPLSTIFNPTNAGNVPTYQGFAGDTRVLPNIITGGRIAKTFNGQSFSLNTINSRTALDSLSNDSRRFEVHTLSFNLDVAKIKIQGELGGGAYSSPTYEKKWGEALMLRFQTPKAYTFLPLDIQVYQISKNFYNPNGEIGTGSNPDIQSEFPVEIAAGQGSVGGFLTQVNQLAHNRRGININTDFELGPVRFKLGWGLAAEIDAITSELSFIHRINGLAFSRMYNPFPANAVSATNFGPYNRYYSFFRGTFERVLTTDLDPATALPINRKFYNAFDLQAKVKTQLAGRSLYIFYLSSFASAKSKASPFPSLDKNSYLFTQYHEIDLYYTLFNNFILTAYFGLENVGGGQYSDWDPVNQIPRDQIGRGIGVGFDWKVADNAGLYLRNRWIYLKDKSIPETVPFGKVDGRETTIELKIFF